MKCWKNQTSKGQKSMGGIQYINKNDGTQIAVDKFYPDAHVNIPNRWGFQAFSKEEARKGYPSQKLGITKKQAMSLLKKYMREHQC